MWARLLFRLRAAMPRLGALLASWKLSAVLMIVGALDYVLLAIWARSAPSHVVQNIASLVPFWAFYVLVLLNTFFCLWRRLPALVRDVAARPVLAESKPRWEASTAAATPEEGTAALRRLGYRVTTGPDGSVQGVRRRWSALGTYVFHGAFFVLAIGFFTTMLFRDEFRVWVAVGEEFTGAQEQFISRSPVRPLSLGAPDVRFGVGRIEPEFWRDELLFTSLSAEVTLAGGEKAVTRINRPLWLGFGTFLRLSGFGYAPRYEIVSGERVLESAFVKMNVFPPGQRDAIRTSLFPHRIYLQVFPDVAVEGGQTVSRSLNLRQPGVLAEVYRGKRALGEKLLRLGDPLPFDGLALRFPEIRYWGEFTLLRDPGAPILLVAFVAALAGLLLKLAGRRGEAQWVPAPGGGLLRGFGAAPRPRSPGAGGRA